MKLQDLGEFGLIARLNSQLGVREGVNLGIGDDAAILSRLKCPVVTTDALVEGIHFRRDWTSPRLLGRKAMAVNVSDLAAMGAQPVAAFVCLSISEGLLNQEDALPWLEELYAGFEDAAKQFGFTVAGGDTTKSRHEIFLGITLIGDCENNPPLRRDGAMPGDTLIVTGTLGDSAAGLYLLQHPELEVDKKTRDYLVQRHLEPEARKRAIFAARACDGRVPAIHAAMDISDGLAGDAAHIARASGVSLEIDAARLPISVQAREVAELAGVPILQWALTGGEDYELLLSVRRKEADTVIKSITEWGETRATIVGSCLDKSEKPEVFIQNAGDDLTNTHGWRHF